MWLQGLPRLTSQAWKRLECVFLAAGFLFVRQSASHRVYEKDGVLRPLIIPTYDSVGKDIIGNLLRTSGMSRTEYFQLLDQC